MSENGDVVTMLFGLIAGLVALTQYQTKMAFSLLKTEIRELRKAINELVKKLD